MIFYGKAGAVKSLELALEPTQLGAKQASYAKKVFSCSKFTEFTFS